MPIIYTGPPIPTNYKGLTFRSQAEARWARFFDMLDWPWHYELAQLHGYLADFVLAFDVPTIVEVKPCFSYVELVQDGDEARAKIDRSGWPREALLLGTCLMRPDALAREFDTLGQLRLVDGTWVRAVLSYCRGCKGFTYHDVIPSTRCRRAGCAEDKLERVNPTRLLGLWVNAQNAGQWKGPEPWHKLKPTANTKDLFGPQSVIAQLSDAGKRAAGELLDADGL